VAESKKGVSGVAKNGVSTEALSKKEESRVVVIK
jgi:hypothetical protein